MEIRSRAQTFKKAKGEGGERMKREKGSGLGGPQSHVTLINHFSLQSRTNHYHHRLSLTTL